MNLPWICRALQELVQAHFLTITFVCKTTEMVKHPLRACAGGNSAEKMTIKCKCLWGCERLKLKEILFTESCCMIHKRIRDLFPSWEERRKGIVLQRHKIHAVMTSQGTENPQLHPAPVWCQRKEWHSANKPIIKSVYSPFPWPFE